MCELLEYNLLSLQWWEDDGRALDDFVMITRDDDNELKALMSLTRQIKWKL